MDTLSVILIAVGSFVALVLLTAYFLKSSIIMNSYNANSDYMSAEADTSQEDELSSDAPVAEEKN